MIEIIKLDKTNKKHLTQFIDFPHGLYAQDPNYVPMIFMEQEALLNPKKSPFFKHSTAEYFLAKKKWWNSRADCRYSQQQSYRFYG